MSKLAKLWLAIVLMACSTAPLRIDSEDSHVENVRTARLSTVNLWGLVKSKNGTPLGKMSATGVVVSVNNGKSIILTAGHCYNKNAEYTVEDYLGREHSAVFYHVSKEYDLGLLWVNVSMGRPADISLAMPEFGASTYVVGNKLGMGMSPTYGLYAGRATKKFARCSAQAHPGNSGGGVWNNHKLIGIVSRIPGIVSSTSHPAVKSKQLFPSINIFVPVAPIHAYLMKHRVFEQVIRPDALKGEHKTVAFRGKVF